MKKYILIILVLLVGVGIFIYLHSVSGPNKDSQIKKEKTEQAKDTNADKISRGEKSNKICAWIEKSDIIIKLDLPEKYTGAASYEVGFLFKSSYGDQARFVRLARKNCDYRVGFSKKDFINLNMAPNSPFAIVAEKNSSTHFSYANWPINISFDKNGTITKGMPENGKTIVIKVNGVVDAFQQYKELFN